MYIATYTFGYQILLCKVYSQHYIGPLLKGNLFKASALLISDEVHAYTIAAQTNCKYNK